MVKGASITGTHEKHKDRYSAQISSDILSFLSSHINGMCDVALQ